MDLQLNMHLTKSFGFLQGGGEMGVFTREKDWDETFIGNPDSWPEVLKTTLSNLLNSRFPMFLWWGQELICFYNDAYRPSLGNEGKHPHILGMPAREAWPEIWDVISPLIEDVLRRGEATWSEDQLIPIFRNGKIEDVYWTFSYSRVNDNNGAAAGVLVTCTETTDKVISLKKLADSKAQLEFAIEAAELGTWDYDPMTNQFSANERLKEWFGFMPSESIGLDHALNCIATGDRERVMNAIQNAMNYSSGRHYDISYTVINARDSSERIVHVKGKAYFNEEKQVYRFNGTMEDITAETYTRLSLEASEQNYRYLIEHAPVAMCVLTGMDFEVAVANEKMFELWGKSREEVMFKPLFDGIPEAKSQGFEEMLAYVMQTGKRITVLEKATFLKRGNGRERVYINFTYEALKTPEGVVSAVVAVAMDVTEQVNARQKIEEAEERMRLAITAGDMGTFDYNLITQESITSGKFDEIFGVPETATHKDYIERIHPDDHVIRQAAFEQAYQTGKLFYELRILPNLDDSLIRWIRIEGKIVYENDLPFRVLGTLVDLTNIREAELKKEEYIAIASHELRNPLTSLKLSLDLLSLSELDVSNHELILSKAKRQVQKIMTLSNELLNVSKISAGLLELKMDIINVHDVIHECINTFHAGSIKNEFKIHGNTNLSIRADKFRIEQVLINLISNASKYSPEASPIEITVDTSPAMIKFSIRDEGIGIDAEKLPHIFKKFIRAEPTGDASGYGLGLYISEQIIRKHGGLMGAASIKGQGSTFWFTLPF